MTDHDAHCRTPRCPCDHLDCHRGWHDQTDGKTRPCQYCRPDTHRRWLEANEARAKGWPQEATSRIMQGMAGPRPT